MEEDALMERFEPPSPVLSDYLELVYLGLLFIFGAPLNLAAYSQLSSGRPSGGFTRLHLLRQHLNLSDLTVILLFAPSKICWLLTYDWRGGLVLCKFVKFLHSFSFQISSNVIVCIALDRLFSVQREGGSGHRAKQRVKVFLWVAWVLSLIQASPQFLVWTIFEPLPKWRQCVTQWTIASFTNTSAPTHLPSENVYVAYHLICVFWLPLTIIGVSYLLINRWIRVNTRAAKRLSVHATTPGGRVKFHLPLVRPRSSSKKTPPPSLADSTSVVEVLAQTEETALPSASNSKSESVRCSGRRLENGNGSQRLVEVEASPSTNRRLFTRRATKVYLANPGGRRYAIRISVLVISAYIICWTPYNALSLWQFFEVEEFAKYSKYVNFLHGILVLNSVINPFLYGMFGTIRRYTRSG